MSKLQLPRPAGTQPAAAQPQPERPQVPLLETDPAKGLTAEQAAQRMAAGLDNRAAASPTRSETEIIRDNIFTFFNLVFIVLALCLALVGSFANMTFLGVVIANTIIGTVQPLQLSLLSMVTIGIPSFILALEPNHEMVHGKFIQNVLRAALPGGLSDLLLILGIEAFVFAFELPIGTLTTLTTLLLLAVGMAVLWDVCKPFTVAHGVLWGGMLILAGAAIALLGGFLGLERLDMRGMLILIAFLLLVVQTLHSMERGLTAVGDAAALVWKRLPRKSKAEENY